MVMEDFRISYLLYERTKCMQERIEYSYCAIKSMTFSILSIWWQRYIGIRYIKINNNV